VYTNILGATAIMSRGGGLDTPYGEQNREGNIPSRPPAPWQWDVFQILGAASAIGSGTARPLMTLVYGGLANEFNNHQDENVGGLKRAVGSETLFLVYLFVGQLVLTWLYGIILSVSAMNYSRRLRAAYLKSVILSRLRTYPVGGLGTHRVGVPMGGL
jgi:hypothetical protein